MERMNKVVKLLGINNIHFMGKQVYDFAGKRCWYNDGTATYAHYTLDINGKHYYLDTKITGRYAYELKDQYFVGTQFFFNQDGLVNYLSSMCVKRDNVCP